MDRTLARSGLFISLLAAGAAHAQPVYSTADRTLIRSLIPAGVQGEVIAQSTFDAGPDGWTLPVSAAWDAALGNPGGCLIGSIHDPANTQPFVFAPAAFLGDWSSLDNAVGTIYFDYTLISLGGGGVAFFLPLTVRIEGPGGAALWEGPTPTGTMPYQTFAVPIEASGWTVESGTWPALLADVQSVRFNLELVGNQAMP